MVHKALVLLRKVPRGKVTTYGVLANITKTSPRAIGRVMRYNKEPKKYPCYKVIKSDGSIGGFGGAIKGKNIKKKVLLLRKDGIKVINEKVDKKYVYRFT